MIPGEATGRGRRRTPSDRGASRRRGQTSTEYVLLLFTVIAFFLILKRAFQPIIERLVAKVGAQVSEKLFQPENLHRFPIKR